MDAKERAAELLSQLIRKPPLFKGFPPERQIDVEEQLKGDALEIVDLIIQAVREEMGKPVA